MWCCTRKYGLITLLTKRLRADLITLSSQETNGVHAAEKRTHLPLITECCKDAGCASHALEQAVQHAIATVTRDAGVDVLDNAARAEVEAEEERVLFKALLWKAAIPVVEVVPADSESHTAHCVRATHYILYAPKQWRNGLLRHPAPARDYPSHVRVTARRPSPL